MTKYPTKQILKKTLENIDNKTDKNKILSHYGHGLDEQLYIELYDILKCVYLSHIKNPSDEFLEKIVSKNWINLYYINVKDRSKTMHEIATKQCCLAKFLNYNKELRAYKEMEPLIKKIN